MSEKTKYPVAFITTHPGGKLTTFMIEEIAHCGNKDRIKVTQISNYADKVLSTAESVFYAGEPSKATITSHLPESVLDIEIISPDLIITFQTSTGQNKVSFASEVPILENSSSPLTVSKGIKKIAVVADASQSIISQV